MTRLLRSLVPLLLLAACSSQSLYLTGQQWQRQACEKLQDRDERTRCLQDASRSHDAYKSGAEQTRHPQ